MGRLVVAEPIFTVARRPAHTVWPRTDTTHQACTYDQGELQ